MLPLPSLVAFGSLATWPAADQLQQLSKALRQQPELSPLVTAIRDLASLWKALLDTDPDLDKVPGQVATAQLAKWIDTGEVAKIDDPQPNIMTMPMTIIAHIAQYFKYLQQRDETISHSSMLESVTAGGGVQGFCSGLLSALAVASARDEGEIGLASATSIRLAFCVGAYVDLDGRRDQGSFDTSSLAIRWRSPASLETVQQVLENHPDVSTTLSMPFTDLFACGWLQ